MKKILTAIPGILCVGMMVGCSPNTSGWESYQINGIIEYKAPPEWECQDSWYENTHVLQNGDSSMSIFYTEAEDGQQALEAYVDQIKNAEPEENIQVGEWKEEKSQKISGKDALHYTQNWVYNGTDCKFDLYGFAYDGGYVVINSQTPYDDSKNDIQEQIDDIISTVKLEQ